MLFATTAGIPFSKQVSFSGDPDFFLGALTPPPQEWLGRLTNTIPRLERGAGWATHQVDHSSPPKEVINPLPLATTRAQNALECLKCWQNSGRIFSNQAKMESQNLGKNSELREKNVSWYRWNVVDPPIFSQLLISDPHQCWLAERRWTALENNALKVLKIP